jgi:hypothetical protein
MSNSQGSERADASLSLIESLAGAELGEVAFVMDYIQFVFQPSETGGRFGRLSTYTLPRLIGPGGVVRQPGSRDYRDGLVDLIGHVVLRGSEVAAELRIAFDDGRALLVSLKIDDSVEVEAAMLAMEDPAEWMVWRPGDIPAR